MSASVRAVLTHPVSMWAKGHLRAAAWQFKGAGVQNPRLPDHVEAVLFVCLGNICRSPFAALLAERLLTDAGRPDIRCTSAGIRPTQAERSPETACKVAATYGLALDSHVPQLLTRELIGAHDIVFVMEVAQVRQVRAAFPEFRDRVFLLSLFDNGARGAYERCNIMDPFGGSIGGFEACYSRLSRALRGWLAASNINSGPA